MAKRTGEAGKGTLSAIIWLLVLAALGYATWNVAPAFMAHYDLQDKLVELARLGRSSNPDDRILQLLMKEVHEQELDQWVHAQNFQISTFETHRRIHVEYDRDLQILPGKSIAHHFVADADQPVAY